MIADYSIIIPAYNEEKYLPETLTNIKLSMDALSEFHGEIIVVNNNSTDNTASIATKLGAKVVFEKHQQIARARNAGGHKAQGQYLIFVDGDTRISPNLLKMTLAVLSSGRCCGGGAMVEFDKQLPFFGNCGLKLWTFLSKNLKWACGAYLFCTHKAFMGTNGFNELYYASEEIHFSRDLKRWGKKRKQNFIILKPPIITSSRKMEWYPWWELLLMSIRMLFYLKPLQNRDACKKMWYRHPDDD
jgi:glycosyltransferase involved in cell wall biosynthesis